MENDYGPSQKEYYADIKITAQEIMLRNKVQVSIGTGVKSLEANV